MVLWAICGTDAPAACSSTWEMRQALTGRGQGVSHTLELLLLSGTLGQVWTDPERNTPYLQFASSLL